MRFILLAILLGSWVGAPRARAGTQDDVKVALHLAPYVSKGELSCSTWEVPCSQFRTNGQVGVSYHAYVVATGGDPETGFAGLSFGVQYERDYGLGVDAFSWASCADLDFPQTDWPLPPRPWVRPEECRTPAGIRLTWDHAANCQQQVMAGFESEGVHAVAGALYVYAYSTDVLSIVPNCLDSGWEFAVSDCGGEVTELPESAAGSIHFTHSGESRGLNPCTGIEDPPPSPDSDPPPGDGPPKRPEPTAAQAAAFLLHIDASGSERHVCDGAPLRARDVVTAAAAEPEGETFYHVYVLASPRVTGTADGQNLRNQELEAVRFGIDTTSEVENGLQIYSWTNCSSSGFATPSWPASGSGNTLVFDGCEAAELTVVGFFYLGAYAPGTLALTGHPSTETLDYVECWSGESAYVPAEFARVGWVSMGGAARGLDSNGCNPLLESCAGAVTPVRSTTWGNLKSRYWGD